ncbi:hypothetical protein ACPXCE_07380 [Streptomyces sp. DT24]|uniref:hypothetical protein n=1 Tax=unclassified Streptomyces TaxID=2593676 RepID=UPI0023BA0352|nr:hypothetical protein [Streptomyces sp. AM 4-1-1]WEH33292.1 hypothetical protein PZB75_07810 [Streptomyces sp. AM 4-1-1]
MGHLVPVLPAVVLMHGIGRADRRLETVATRPINRWDTALGLSVAALSAVTAIGVDLSLDKDIALVIGRNTAGYIGIAMLVAAFLGTRTAALLTTVVPLVLGATGWTPAGAPRHWAWLLHPAHSSLAFLMTALALAAGASATCVRRGPLRGL